MSMRSLIIRRLVFILIILVAYLASLQWEKYYSEAIINDLLAGTLEEADYDIRWLNPGDGLGRHIEVFRDSQLIKAEAEIFYGQLYLLRLPSGQQVLTAIYPGLFWPDSITFRRVDL